MSRRSLVSLVFLAALILPAPAADPNKREAVAVLTTESGTVLARELIGKEWKPILQNQDVFSEDSLVGLNAAVLQSKNKAVELRTVTDLSNRSPFPIIETSIRLNAGKNVDLDLWLDRGRIDVTNVKKEGSATLVVRFRGRIWTMVLEKPGTRIAMEAYSRWPEGTKFSDKPKTGEEPVMSVLLVLLKGEVQRSCSLCSVAMTAPPGPAQFGWDSINGDDRAARRLDALPEWVKDLDLNSEETKRRRTMQEKFRTVLMKDGLGTALVSLLDSKDPEARRVGVYGLAAFDQLQTLGDLLARSKDAETWNNAVIALRHWLGRGAAQEQILNKRLIARGLTPAHAKIVLQLLLGFSEEERGRPELFKVLIDLLRHERLAIRGLAYWHLQRLAPMVKIAYNPLGEKAEWDRAHDEFKKAVAAGELPPKN